MSRFINTELKSDSDSDSELELDSEEKSKSDTELIAKLNLILILNKSFYSYIFVDFEQVLFMPIFLRPRFFTQALFQTYFLLGLKYTNISISSTRYNFTTMFS